MVEAHKGGGRQDTMSGFATALCTQPDGAYSHRTTRNAFQGAYSHVSRYIRCSCMLHLEKKNEMH